MKLAVRAGLLSVLPAFGLVMALPSVAAELSGLEAAPPGALSCAGCHAERAGSGSSVPPLAGRPVEEIVAALDEYRTGRRPATVMNRIAPGFTPAESRAIAGWLSERKPAP